MQAWRGQSPLFPLPPTPPWPRRSEASNPTRCGGATTVTPAETIAVWEGRALEKDVGRDDDDGTEGGPGCRGGAAPAVSQGSLRFRQRALTRDAAPTPRGRPWPRTPHEDPAGWRGGGGTRPHGPRKSTGRGRHSPDRQGIVGSHMHTPHKQAYDNEKKNTTPRRTTRPCTYSHAVGACDGP